ncbi:MAG TPA: TusE/DsrC/DsvC family sulfur relay protein [Spirochaetota bacterium]|nr:TusE/DsrC/DsvC family sulfur relay protein [Spirochaetota bacterium]OPZ35756.1 MAG: Sulfite reductase, dissimilatory-type subunit gamma [Spirochaetes bacterium ADurb.BinA120]HNU90372.1 TusE/DsrC/DsvC family sulfur relay protein [Spirochaetota bacterium]HPI14996.1 TusE/DsrC/DsvC family sulfur relay protein [Spirochaetota bacterium]HPO46924.1 TusE/DsrC/DsvC family sulfur relay protein [Spirochaetota bacterium]
MASINLHGNSYEVDEDGFLQEPDKWTEDVAKAMAEMEGITDLNETHWKVMNYLRDYFKQNGIAPMVRKLTKDTGVNLKEMYELFPQGPANSACKWAGLPKPTGCV